MLEASRAPALLNDVTRVCDKASTVFLVNALTFIAARSKIITCLQDVG